MYENEDGASNIEIILHMKASGDNYARQTVSIMECELDYIFEKSGTMFFLKEELREYVKDLIYGGSDMRIDVLSENSKKLMRSWWGKKTVLGDALKCMYEATMRDECMVSDEDLKSYVKGCGHKDLKVLKKVYNLSDDFKGVYYKDCDFTCLKMGVTEYIENVLMKA